MRVEVELAQVGPEQVIVDTVFIIYVVMLDRESGFCGCKAKSRERWVKLSYGLDSGYLAR